MALRGLPVAKSLAPMLSGAEALWQCLRHAWRPNRPRKRLFWMNSFMWQCKWSAPVPNTAFVFPRRPPMTPLFVNGSWNCAKIPSAVRKRSVNLCILGLCRLLPLSHAVSNERSVRDICRKSSSLTLICASRVVAIARMEGRFTPSANSSFRRGQWPGAQHCKYQRTQKRDTDGADRRSAG